MIRFQSIWTKMFANVNEIFNLNPIQKLKLNLENQIVRN
jgi:hypothetical protein